MAQYNKLVRDKIPEILDAKGVMYEKRVANDEEYRDALVEKLLEEAQEFAEERTPEELADVLEVLRSLRNLPEYARVESLREQKEQERGGFEARIILKGEK